MAKKGTKVCPECRGKGCITIILKSGREWTKNCPTCKGARYLPA